MPRSNKKKNNQGESSATEGINPDLQTTGHTNVALNSVGTGKSKTKAISSVDGAIDADFVDGEKKPSKKKAAEIENQLQRKLQQEERAKQIALENEEADRLEKKAPGKVVK